MYQNKNTKLPAIKESEIQKTIKEYLQYKGFFVVKIHQSLGSYKGIADLVAIKSCVTIWIEVKTEKGKLSKYQEQFQQDIEEHGGMYWICRNIEDLKSHMRDYDLLK